MWFCDAGHGQQRFHRVRHARKSAGVAQTVWLISDSVTRRLSDSVMNGSQSYRVTELPSYRVTELLSHRLTDQGNGLSLQTTSSRKHRPVEALRRGRGAHARRLEGARWVSRARAGARHGSARDPGGGEGLRPAWPWRSGFSYGIEVVVHEAERRQAALP